MCSGQRTMKSGRTKISKELGIGCARGDTADVGGAIQDKPVRPLGTRRLAPDGHRTTIGAEYSVYVNIGEPETRGKHTW